ncbi:MAG: DUF418 domain-containing protein [Gammaproteobacteria bacterium]|nr:DUF418 domain-containing protein [Gammaproteobacteria bacterium]
MTDASLTGPAPVAPSVRIESIDVVRGFALLGILLLNILGFGLPFRAYFDPSVDGAVAGIDFGVYVGVELFAEGAMRALFSMLFGAGVAILATGARAKGPGIYYRRQLLLLAIGLFDAFVLLWVGDILVPYALAGLVLYLCRNWQPRALVASAVVVFLYLATACGGMWLILSIPAFTDDPGALEAWRQTKAAFTPTEAALATERIRFEGAYPEAFAANAQAVLATYAQGLPLFIFWDALACMLLGMALYKTGVLQGQRSVRFYVVLAICGFGIGLAVNAFEVTMKVTSGFDLKWVSGASVPTNDLGRVSMGLGYASLVMIICARGWLARVRYGLAAAGRMALSNYILQSIFGLLLFHDIGLGLWNELARSELYIIVLAQWAVMIEFSTWWLRRFRFGPLEWLWRSLTYGRFQPMAVR